MAEDRTNQELDLEIAKETAKETTKEMAKEEKKSSMFAAFVRDMIALMTADRLIGPKLQNGEIRKNLVEAPWKCPACFHVTQIDLAHCKAELLSLVQNPSLNRVILQLHGGGYIGAMRNKYRSFAGLYNEIGSGINVFTPDYRVAPENPYPAALEDALDAWQWLMQSGVQPGKIVIAGDSAGGGLALALCLYLKDHGMELPEGLILMSPWTDLTASGESYETNYTLDPLFGNTKESMIFNRDYVGDEDPTNPYISPLFGSYEGFPPMLIQVGSIEMLLSDSTMLAKKAKEAGVKVRLSIYEGMFHVFQMGELMLQESKKRGKKPESFCGC
ncbi:Acetyl esterase [Eubacterium plexicaudatum ASF492]|nr:Acetyl esterase [Eubacterium plexicaudatum ASF492]